MDVYDTSLQDSRAGDGKNIHIWACIAGTQRVHFFCPCALLIIPSEGFKDQLMKENLASPECPLDVLFATGPHPPVKPKEIAATTPSLNVVCRFSYLHKLSNKLFASSAPKCFNIVTACRGFQHELLRVANYITVEVEAAISTPSVRHHSKE